jgi:hypothetical protein
LATQYEVVAEWMDDFSDKCLGRHQVLSYFESIWINKLEHFTSLFKRLKNSPLIFLQDHVLRPLGFNKSYVILFHQTTVDVFLLVDQIGDLRFDWLDNRLVRIFVADLPTLSWTTHIWFKLSIHLQIF